jgi:hypothetical protein
MTTATTPRHEYMDPYEAAGYLRISVNTLNCWRSRREGPPFVKIGGKVRYRLADLEAYADRRRRDPSSSGSTQKKTPALARGPVVSLERSKPVDLESPRRPLAISARKPIA